MSDNNNVFGKVIVDTGDIKRSKFSLNHQVSTSMDIGELQPLCCRLLKPKSKTTCRGRHLVRLDPMVAPSVGSLKQKTWHHFVGMSELTRKFSALLTKSLVSGSTTFFRPQNLPYMALADISALCLIGADYSVYVHAPTSGEGPDDALTTWKLYSNGDTSAAAVAARNWVTGCFNSSFSASCFPSFSGGAVDLNLFFGSQYSANTLLPCGRAAVSTFFHRPSAFDPSTASNAWSEVPLNSADYVVRNQFTNGGTTYQVAIAVRLSAFGKRIRKILIGCGYRINFLASGKNMSLMPLFAYYKAYFDSFGLTLYTSWESSRAKLLLERYDVGLLSNLGIVQGVSDDELFLQFICSELGRTYVTEDYDYVSAHQASDSLSPFDVNSEKDRGFVNNIILGTPAAPGTGISGIGQTNLSSSSVVSNVTGHVYINRVSHTEVDAELLKVLYKWTNRETAAGKRIAELLRAGGFGRYVDEQKSNFIGYEELDIDIVDVNATADSSNTVVGANSTLGEYVGKGVGVTKQGDIKTFEFENDEFGYWITLSAIVPESGFCQGIDPLNEVIDADHFYAQEFDGLGMELEDFTLVKGDTDWQNRLDTNEVGRFSASFGMVPRHTRWKVSHNIVNGDIDLRSTRAGNLPFMLDKYISVGDRDCKLTSNSASEYVYRVIKGLQITDLPVAGAAWRYLNRYPWLNNFDRIFANLSTDVERFQNVLQGIISIGNYEYTAYGRDHFNVFNWFDMVTYSGMKPISESYGTTDENDGNGDMTMSRA